MTTADDRDQDVWAQAVAEGAGASIPGPGSEPVPEAAPTAGSELFGPELGPLVEEVRKFASSLGEKVTAVSSAVGGGDSLGALQNLAAPLRSKHPEVYGHLIAAGGELLAAYRSAVQSSERRWTAEKPAASEQIDLD
ncbi:DUF5304 family protein [Streptacidiphilus cavernicola]|uniref:DUF5304 family protein n=1 Tax=Streptacidiphilus cavernicola TaxID=3342716 RepID=A0ABV6VSQ7_9ACTN